jgi:hypothetical protein
MNELFAPQRMVQNVLMQIVFCGMAVLSARLGILLECISSCTSVR